MSDQPQLPPTKPHDSLTSKQPNNNTPKGKFSIATLVGGGWLLLKLGKFGKILLTSGSMLLSIGVYALLFGWKFAVGFVLLMFIHELGHYVAARKAGLNVGAISFIPFLGAWVNLKDQPMNVETEANIAFAGPFWGTAASVICFLAARYLNNNDTNLLLALAYTGFFINLINLIPMMPFDGGRISQIISPALWLFGLPLMIVFFIWRPSPILILIGLLSLPYIFNFKSYMYEFKHSTYFQTKPNIRFKYGFYYLSLILFLAITTYNLHNELSDKLH